MSKSPVRRHLPFLFGAAAGVAMAAIVLCLVHPTAASVGGAITFFLIYLVHTATRISPPDRGSHEDQCGQRRRAGRAHPSHHRRRRRRWRSFHCSSCCNRRRQPDPLQLALSLATVALGWFTIHTMTALHYAHLYWRPDGNRERQGQAASRARIPRRERARRLRLPLFRLRDGHDRADVGRRDHQHGDAQVQPAPRHRFVLLQHGAGAAAVNVVIFAGELIAAVSRCNASKITQSSRNHA